jgi:ubiquinone/menaquinone biosynthesis C-methylase UbiE
MQDRWFSEWFNQDYLKVYAHRDETDAELLASLIDSNLPAIEGGRTLDLGCGAGRHLPYLMRRQRTIGLDLSRWLLAVARAKAPDASLTRADMRALPFADRTFSLVASLFTSFGYFNDDEQNALVLREIARVTEPEGWLVLDFLHASHARRSVVPFDRQQMGSVRVDQRRRLSPSGRFIVKEIKLDDSDTQFVERVRLFGVGDLSAMIAECGFHVRQVFGDYQGRPLEAQSPRVIIFAQRAGW